MKSSQGIATTATENNYLKHAELLQYGQALDKCRNDKDAKACEAVNQWERLSRQRDEALLVACVSKVNAQRCEALKEEAKAADREYVAAFGDKLGEYLGKDVGYSKVTPGEVYFNHSPSAALRDVAVSKGLVAQINREKNDEELSPKARKAANSLTYQILNSDELTLEDKAIALGELRNDLRAINGIRQHDTGIFGRYGAAAQLNLESSGGDLRTYLQTSVPFKERFSAALDGAGGAGTVATAAVGGAAEHVTNIALGKAAVAIGAISRKLNAPKLDLKFWNDPIEVNGRRVYQRDDLFELTPANRTLMAQGNAPFGFDGKRVVLHHLTQDEPGAVAEISGRYHEVNTKVIHGFEPNGKSFRNDPALDSQFRSYREDYWRYRLAQILQRGK